MELKTELTQDKKVWTLKPIGNIHARTANTMWHFDSLDDLVSAFVEAGAESLVIELSETKSMDSHALRLLLNAQREFKAHNVRITLRNPNLHINRLFKIMKFDSVFNVEV